MGTVEIRLELNEEVFLSLAEGSGRHAEFYTFADAGTAGYSGDTETAERVASTINVEPLLSPAVAVDLATIGAETRQIEIAGMAYGSAVAPITDFAGTTVAWHICWCHLKRFM